MSGYEIVYVGGPAHGERRVIEGDLMKPYNFVRVPIMKMGEIADAVYEIRPLADTPGAITYQYIGDKARI